MTETASPSRQVLDDTPRRVLKFLSGLSTNDTIRALLEARGYSNDDHQEGWRLLLAVTGYKRNDAADAFVPTINKVVRDAITELDAWDEPNFRVIRAALERRHPDQATFVFANDLSAAQGAAAVLSVATLLDRLDALDQSDERKKTRKADHAALETLSKRGITAAERKRLRALVDVVRNAERSSAPAAVVSPRSEAAAPPTDDQRLALYEWFREWAEIARATVRRKDYLILLGLAKRKITKKS